MADLCVRYAALLDAHLPSMTACLKDSSVLVRRQTLMLLTRCDVRTAHLILQPDLRGLHQAQGILVFPSCCCRHGSRRGRGITWSGNPDLNPDCTASFCLTESLHTKDQSVFVSVYPSCTALSRQHFVECVFHFNSCKAHPTFNQFPESEREQTLFSLQVGLLLGA